MKTGIISKVGLSFVASILILSGLVVAQGLQDVISTLKEIGVFQFYLPFIISFAILFGLLQKIQLLPDKRLNIIIALAISAFVMVYTPVGITLSQFFTNLFGNAIVIILTFIVIAIFINVLSTGKIFDFQMFTKGNNYLIGVALFILLVIGVFVASGGTAIFPGLKISPKQWLSGAFGISSTTLAIIILVVGTGLIVWIFSKKDEDKAAGGGKGGGS